VHPQRDSGEECRDDDAANQHLPDHAGIERAELAQRRKDTGGGGGGAERRNGDDHANDSLRGNQDLAASLPILVSHQSPADLWPQCLA
jgi:hypothetical protein